MPTTPPDKLLASATVEDQNGIAPTPPLVKTELIAPFVKNNVLSALFWYGILPTTPPFKSFAKVAVPVIVPEEPQLIFPTFNVFVSLT